jgi:tetratricopeptide (TPR) repeat protein
MNYRILVFGFLAITISSHLNESKAQSLSEGVLLRQQGKFKEARLFFENVLKNDENNADAHSNLGMIYLDRRNSEYDVDKAVDETEKAVELNPNKGEIQFNYGAALGIKTQNSGVFKQAFLAVKVKKAFQRAVELDPNLLMARIALGQFYLMAPSIIGGDNDEGWKQIDEAIKIDEVQGRFVKASMLAQKDNKPDAEKEYKTLVSSYPKEWRTWKGYGYFCLREKRTDEAIKHFQKYVDLRPDTADSYQSLAEALIKKGEADEALENLHKSLSLDKEYVPAIISVGDAYIIKGQKKEAKESYQRAISLAQFDYYKKQAEKKLKEVE